MNYLKTFLLGVGTAFVVYYITRKSEDGKSILDGILDDPDKLVDKAKDFAMENLGRAVHEFTK